MSTTVAEFVVQDQYLESNTDLFNQLVARWGKKKALYPTRNNSKWTFMMREVLDRLMTPELQAEFNWGGMLGALSTQEKSKFQNTTHSKLVMQVVTLRTTQSILQRSRVDAGIRNACLHQPLKRKVEEDQ